MCQASFAMKIAKNCAIMVDVNKKVVVCLRKVVYLYNVHKSPYGFL